MITTFFGGKSKALSATAEGSDLVPESKPTAKLDAAAKKATASKAAAPVGGRGRGRGRGRSKPEATGATPSVAPGASASAASCPMAEAVSATSPTLEPAASAQGSQAGLLGTFLLGVPASRAASPPQAPSNPPPSSASVATPLSAACDTTPAEAKKRKLGEDDDKAKPKGTADEEVGALRLRSPPASEEIPVTQKWQALFSKPKAAPVAPSHPAETVEAKGKPGVEEIEVSLKRSAGATAEPPAAGAFDGGARESAPADPRAGLSTEAPAISEVAAIVPACQSPPIQPGEDADDECYACKDGGELMLCDTCPRAYHPMCVGLREVPEGDWACPACSSGVEGCGSARLQSEIPATQDFGMGSDSLRQEVQNAEVGDSDVTPPTTKTDQEACAVQDAGFPSSKESADVGVAAEAVHEGPVRETGTARPSRAAKTSALSTISMLMSGARAMAGAVEAAKPKKARADVKGSAGRGRQRKAAADDEDEDEDEEFQVSKPRKKAAIFMSAAERRQVALVRLAAWLAAESSEQPTLWRDGREGAV
ncbi:hypothetical protein CYMTET_25697 [Cymbomonas tetramitiformis]|uniref:PHD-type domain-containing protein n=1 Tax=Cymbomonas tetramitiformis TaxID=36881 RepID=A0AAE0FT77_9CHLO|nr:hypothetical protein CYMTET_25697 [Cymbomonas tetramitiformis]